MDKKNERNLTTSRCGLFNYILLNQHNIRIEDSNAIRLLICTRINDQYEQTLHYSIPAHNHKMLILCIIISFFFSKKNYLMLSLTMSVRPSVRPSVCPSFV